MATDLTAYFEEGRAARRAAGRTFAPRLNVAPISSEPNNPYIFSSPASDAWFTGWAHECDAMAGNALARTYVSSARAGRGNSVNVNHPGGTLRYAMDYDRAPCPAYLRVA